MHNHQSRQSYHACNVLSAGQVMTWQNKNIKNLNHEKSYKLMNKSQNVTIFLCAGNNIGRCCLHNHRGLIVTVYCQNHLLLFHFSVLEKFQRSLGGIPRIQFHAVNSTCLFPLVTEPNHCGGNIFRSKTFVSYQLVHYGVVERWQKQQCKSMIDVFVLDPMSARLRRA